jgi:hypothetical protein
LDLSWLEVNPIILFRLREELLLLKNSTIQKFAYAIHLGFKHPLALGK